MARRRSPNHVALGEAIRQTRKELRLSQEALAEVSGLHRNYIGGVERGELNPSYTSILRIAAALGIPGSELLARAESIRS